MRPLLPEQWGQFGVIHARDAKLPQIAQDFIACLKEEIDKRVLPGSIEVCDA